MNRKIKSRFCAITALLLAFACALPPTSVAAAETGTSDSVTATIPSAGTPAESEPPQDTSAAAEEAADEVPPADDPIVVPPPMFPDVFEDDWFYADVTRLAQEKILNGYPDGYFHPSSEITNAEFVKILMLSVGADITVKPELVFFSEHWSSAYISLAYERGIITDDDLIMGFDPSAPITRSAMTKMMILALGIEPARIDDPFCDISDIYASTAYKEYLLRGYLVEDGTRIYNGAGNALRSEAAAIVVRVLNYREDAYAYKKDAILQNASENELNTESELIDLFYILNREFMTEFTFKTEVPFEIWEHYYRHANVIYLEYFYTSSLRCSYDPEEPLIYKVTLEYSQDIETLKQLHAESEARVDKIVESVMSEGMSDADKVKAIHDYLILNCEYDYNSYLAGTVSFESRLAYGVLCQKSAVCQGYTAAFNLLCRRAGVRSVVVTGTAPASTDDHAWNMVLIDGQIYHIDTTHDDPVPDVTGRISYRYYMLTEAEMAEMGYVWDKSHSNLKYFY